MSALDELLESLVAENAFRLDWNDVLARAGEAPRASGRLRFGLAVAGVALTLAVIGSALGAAGIGPLAPIRSWLAGAPGRPASPAASRAFKAANGHSWASFPASTDLRELISRTFGGQRYVLYGFRSGDSVCLTLRAVTLRTTLRPACAPVSVVTHLSAPVVPLGGDLQVLAFPGERSARASFGIAADQVRRVVVQTVNGDHRAVLGGNAYLWVDVAPASFDPVRSLRVGLESGRVAKLAVPSADPLLLMTSARARGPGKVEETIRHPGIGWVERGEKRGLTPDQAHLTEKQRFGIGRSGAVRIFKPDPTSDLVVGLDGGCLYFDGAVGCINPAEMFGRGPLYFLVSGGGLANSSDRFVEVGGVAADGVAAVRAYLPDGTALRLALHDNVFAGVVPNAPPSWLVAYARDGRIAGVEPLGFARPVPAGARRLRPLLRTVGATGVTATLSLGPTVHGARCWAIATSTGRGQDECEGVMVTGPSVAIEGVQDASGSVFVFGWFRRPVTRVSVRFDDGRRVPAKLRRGWFLASVPAGELSPSRRHARVVGTDAAGTVVQQPAFFYRA